MCGGSIGRVATGIATGGLSEVANAFKPKPLPQVPGLSNPEQEALRQNNLTLQQLNQILSGEQSTLTQNRDLLRQFSGLYNADGSVNQTAVDDLKGRINGQQQIQDTINQNALGQLQSMFGGDLNNISDEAGIAEARRYLNALNGEIPISNAQLSAEKRQFEQLRESAGQRGIKIEGDDPFSATSQSTAGNQILADLRQQFNSQRDAQQQAELDRGANVNLNRLGFGLQQGQFAQGLVQQPGAADLGFLQSSFGQTPASLLPGYTNLGQSYLQSAQPYTDQRMLGYQRDIQNTSNRNGFYRDLLGFGAQLGGAALTGGRSAAAPSVPR